MRIDNASALKLVKNPEFHRRTKHIEIRHYFVREKFQEELYTQVEVLDLTHDLSCPFKLEFDDSHWQDHLSSLKPIGLAILLNTCNMATQEHYVQFCSHVTAEALYNEDLVPVTNRRCLCELSNQIGFTDRAKSNFSLKQQLSTFRHVQPETVRRDIKFARSLALATKLKLPFPHMVAVVISDNTTPGSLQLFSQATGDIALDSCIDFWDGNTLRVLSPSDRKKILDFYQRTSLTAYCTAFAYRPLGKSVNPSLSGIYMELPSESHNLYLRNRSPTPLDWDLHRSEDSLFGSETLDGEISDIEGCFETQCNQIFLGMVTMQYQAQIEMVQLIEQLERACIRFVHFSKENELRSRVFSEKMGLESGWNCHISLLSRLTPKKDGTPVDATSQDWQSLSCLTDSTEQSAPINFDMSNRAKLPRGIEQIRPHLEKVDNVPLLVSLFTDCTPSTTLEMIEIMQDYGEIVCVMGSSANADNSSIFLKANTSVSVEPLYPQVCQKVPVFTPCPDGIAPVHLSHRLNSLPCSVSMTRQRPISFFHLIMHARHFMQCLWTCVQFWMSGVTAVSLVQLITTIVLLPPIFTVVCISCGFVHREHLSWRRSPLKNRKWASACFFFLLCQTGYVLVNFSDIDVPWIAFGLAIASIFIVAIVNELVKWQEIKANMRYEKRARLDFGTKLGMNSPF
ncbi:unnamed protein product [Nesidiocoris tenuis]|uniref:Uncharacterized protein n=1 Tax=Nesidiocoris tenuis TaxID=355587 RepID=A0A6H5GZ06_9HEMI|nr:unnamed protein product [Nesidiocoris tenuis]